MHHNEPPVPARACADVGALGLDIRVIVDDDELRELVRRLWADCTNRPRRGDPIPIRVRGREPWRVTSDAHTEEAASLPVAVGAVCAAINLTVATQTPLLAVHAAVLQKHRTTILIPGESGAGKTTLTVALLQARWAYASDEAFALDWNSGNTLTYPRPLGVSDWTAEKLAAPAGVPGVGERFLRGADFGATVAGGGYHVDHVVLLDRTEPVEQPSLTGIHRAEALEVLVRQGFTHYRDPERAIRLLTDVVRGAQTWSLRYAEPQQAAQFLGQMLTGEDDHLGDRPIAQSDHPPDGVRETIAGDVSDKRVGGDADQCSRSRGALDVADETA